MKTEIEYKLGKIADIWNHFILEYRFCSNKIKFNEEVKTNYFGDILGYFHDTFGLIFDTKIYSGYSEKFSFTISFLQAIYVQQDFIQELLEIFKCGITKGDLKKDTNYTVSREIRNELVGHPIRKYEGKLVSSSLFSYQSSDNEIQYLRYHKDNRYKFEVKTFLIAEIQERHKAFLIKYFDTILNKSKQILNKYTKELSKVRQIIEEKPFEIVLRMVDLNFESIFESNFIYDKESLMKIYKKKNEHRRYQNLIDLFYNDLRNYLDETKRNIEDVFAPFVRTENVVYEIPIIEYINADSLSEDSKRDIQKETYHYEIGKLATKRNVRDFEFFGGILKSKCQDNKLVIDELKHMETHIFDEIEYYTSLELIRTELITE